MRLLLLRGLPPLIVALLSLLSNPALAASSTQVIFTSVTLTATKSGGDTAISLKVQNRGASAVSVTAVSSRIAEGAMLFTDVNLLQGIHQMVGLPNISVRAGGVQTFGFRGIGAMLAGVTQSLRRGEIVPLAVHWNNAAGSHVAQVWARVILAPAHINFGMSRKA